MKKFQVLLLAFSILSFAHAQPDLTIRVDPKYAGGGAASDFFDEIRYIPLESTKESTFGAIQRLQTSTHYFVFFDYSTRSVFSFDRSGKFIGKISSLPLIAKGETAVLGLYYFVLDRSSENIYIVYDRGDKKHSKRLAVFSTEGQLLRSADLNEKFCELSPSFVFLDHNRTLFSSGNNYEKNASPYYFYIVSDFDSVVSGVLPQEQGDPLGKSWHNQLDNNAVSEEGSLWYRLYDKSVYYASANGSINAYKFVLPVSLTLDSTFYKDPSILSTEQSVNAYLKEHQNHISFLASLNRTGNLLAFTLVRYNYSLPSDSYLYSLTSGNLYRNTQIIPDSLCYFLPLFSSSEISGMEGGYIYLSIPAFSMFARIEENKNNLWQSNPVLKTYFTTQNRKSNSVLVQLKLKGKL